MAKIGRNERCPCGSGKKYKHCCLGKNEAEVNHTSEQRMEAIGALLWFTDHHLDEERSEAEAEAWGYLLDRCEEVDPSWNEPSEGLINAWFWFDRPLADGHLPVDLLLAASPQLSAGARTWLQRMRDSVMKLYEVTDAVPGVSIALREVLSGAPVTVRERSASRMASRGQLLAARVIRAGVSGQPELDYAMIALAPLSRRQLVADLQEWYDEHRAAHPGAPDDTFWRQTPPFLHEVWMSSILDPIVPTLLNTDGEPMVLTHLRFSVLDEAALVAALDGAEGVERDEGLRWMWSALNAQSKLVMLGTLRVVDSVLHLESNSVARGERGRALIEAAAGQAVSFIAASHEDPTERIRDAARRGDRGEPEEDPIPRELLEELALADMSGHYRAWVDEPVPALDGKTPRAAAGIPAYQPRVAELIRGLEGMYQDALRGDQPAYDPTWMWEELGLADGQVEHPPPLAHERLDAAHAGLSAVARALAGHIRARPDFDDKTTRCQPADLREDLSARRLSERDAVVARHLGWLVDFELHRRKTFWVDRALSWMFLQTELDVTGADLRLPFVAFALVYTDRAALSLAERLLAARRDSPVAGHFARVLTVYVTRSSERGLHLRFAIDALGDDPPELIEHVMPLGAGVQGVEIGKIPSPLPGLVHLVLNAILYITSPGVEPVARRSPARERPRPAPQAPPLSSEEVYYLPGAIEISRLRQMQALERAPGGRQILHRFMVRGHWRRPNASWKDQSPRWIQPYWKGPALGPVVERAYQLKP